MVEPHDQSNLKRRGSFAISEGYRVYEGRMVWQHAAAILVGAEAEISHLELHVCIDVPMCV